MAGEPALTGAAAQACQGEEQGAEGLWQEGVQLRQAQLHQLCHALGARVEVLRAAWDRRRGARAAVRGGQAKASCSSCATQGLGGQFSSLH